MKRLLRCILSYTRSFSNYYLISNTGLGGGAIAAIILSILVATVFIMGVAYFLVKNRQSKAPTDAEPKLGFDNVLYTPSADDAQVESKGASDA